MKHSFEIIVRRAKLYRFSLPNVQNFPDCAHQPCSQPNQSKKPENVDNSSVTTSKSRKQHKNVLGYFIRSALPYAKWRTKKNKKYKSIALADLYKLKQKLAWSSSPYLWKKMKTEKIRGKKTHNFALGPLQRVRGTFFQKSETANRKRMKRWSRNSTFSFQYLTNKQI